MSAGTLEVLAGLALALVTLRDVFDTVVVPGGSHATLRIARRSVGLLLPLWKLWRPRGGISTSFAPAVLVLSFVTWMALLAAAFGLMAHGLAASFEPPLPSYAQAVYLAGSGLVTIGLSETDAHGAAQWVVLASGFCGLAVMTMAVTYLLTVQTSLASRDAGLLKLETSAGDPPSAITLIEKYAAISAVAHIADVLEDGRNWAANVQQSHTTHPSLIYFRSVGTGAGWPAGLGALLDLALIAERLVDLPEARGCAILMREEGMTMAREIIALLRIPPAAAAGASEPDLSRLCERLRSAGLGLQDGFDREGFLTARAEHDRLVRALSAHLGLPAAALG